MSLWLERLGKYHEGKRNQPRADLFAALAAEERANKTPETFSDLLVLPEGVRRLPDLTIGGKKPKELGKILTPDGNKISENAEYVLSKTPTLSRQETISPVIVPVYALGLEGNPTTDQIYQRGDELGFDKCPAEVGPWLRYSYKDQPLNEVLRIAMDQITGRRGIPEVFTVERDVVGSWLGTRWAVPDGRWGPSGLWVFALRKQNK